MKTTAGILIGIALCLVAAAMAPQKRYWQDQILKPDQAWIEAYGYQGESVLAFNVRQLTLAVNNQDQVDKQLAAMIQKLMPKDPNDTRQQVPKSGDAAGKRDNKATGGNVPGVPETRPAGGPTGGQ